MPSQYNPNKHHRRSIRLKGYDYTAAGSYFITICTHQRQWLFGEIVNGQMILNETGQCVQSVWMNLPQHFRWLELDEFVVMPNHVHGVLSLRGGDDRGEAFAPRSGDHSVNSHANASPLPGCESPSQDDRPPHQEDRTSPRAIGTQPQSIAAIIQNFKSVSTRKINRMQQTSGRTSWQRNYYEHIIRDGRALQNIRRYIQNNPLAWREDRLHAHRTSKL